MKKFYSTIAAIFAAAAITALAVGPELVQPSYKPFPLTVKGAPSEKAVNQINRLATEESYQGPTRIKQNVDAASLAGDYVMLSTSVFNTNTDGISGLNQTLAAQPDGTLVFEGILGFKQDTYNASVLVLNIPNGGPTATVNGNTVTLPLGQFGTCTYISGEQSYELEALLIGYQGVDWSTGQFVGLLEEGNINFTVDTNGNLTADYGFGIYVNQLGWMCGAENVKIVKPNGTVSADFSSNQYIGNYSIPSYIERSTNEEGFEQLFVSTLLPSGIAQYGATFDIETNQAMAIEQALGDPLTEQDETGQYVTVSEPYYLCSLIEEDPGYAKNVIATFSEDGKTLTFDSQWSLVAPLLDGSGASWYGACMPATISFEYAGVEDIIVDSNNANAPVEYFNLQGIRVANPEAGQLLIRRQGTEVSKILVK